jgi:hypothetical protein
MIIFNKNQSGFASLLTIIIIGASTLIMAVGASFLSMGELDMSTSSVKGGKTLSYAESCIEEGLRRILLDDSFLVDNQAVLIGEGQCILSVSGSGSDRLVVGEGIVDTYHKRIEVSLSLDDREITINNWEEKYN